MDQHAIELARKVGVLLKGAGWRLATAESCSGGLIGHLLTEIPGSSAYYQGGVIAYDNAVKLRVLRVGLETIERFGAVSETCALEMAAGVRSLLGTEVAVATTGIAGPGGGSDEKPVGLVYIAIATPAGSSCGRFVFGNDRGVNKLETAHRALAMIAATLEQPQPT